MPVLTPSWTRLVLQILEITDRVVVCLNLMDEARRHGIAVDAAKLSQELGVPVVPAAARRGEGIPELLEAIDDVAANVEGAKALGLAALHFVSPAKLRSDLVKLALL